MTGIYLLTHAPTGRRYVGSSRDLSQRERMHRLDMANGSHHNRRIRDLVAQHGEASFEFEVLEHCTIDDLFDREARWCEKLRPDLNISSPPGSVIQFGPEMTAIFIEVPHTLHRLVKVAAVNAGMTMKEFVTDVLSEKVGFRGGESQDKPAKPKGK